MLKIGILLPNAANYPFLASHYVSGLQLALDQQKVEHEIFFESASNGSNKEILLEKAQKLFIQSRVQILIVYAANRNLQDLLNLAEANRRMLFFTNLGTSPLLAPDHNYLLSSTFNMWESAFYNGLNLGKEKAKVWVATGFYEGGYQLSTALTAGLEVHGGTIMGHSIVQDKWEKQTVEGLLEVAKEATALHTTLSEPDVGDFLNHYSELEGSKDIRSAGMTHLGRISQANKPIEMKGHVAWHEELDIDENKNFLSAYRAENDEQPTLFSQMGHEAGLILSKQKELGAFDARSGFVKQNHKIHSSRGTISLENNSNIFIAPQYSFNMVKNKVDGDIIKTLENISDQKDVEKALSKMDFDILAGWLNPYPCT